MSNPTLPVTFIGAPPGFPHQNKKANPKIPHRIPQESPLKGGLPRISDSILLDTTRNTTRALVVVISNCSARHTEQFDTKKNNARVVFFLEIFPIESLSFVMHWCWWRGY
jgi:hypothetical protein